MEQAQEQISLHGVSCASCSVWGLLQLVTISSQLSSCQSENEVGLFQLLGFCWGLLHCFRRTLIVLVLPLKGMSTNISLLSSRTNLTSVSPHPRQGHTTLDIPCGLSDLESPSPIMYMILLMLFLSVTFLKKYFE